MRQSLEPVRRGIATQSPTPFKVWSQKSMFSGNHNTKRSGSINPGSFVLGLLVCQSAWGGAPDANPAEKTPARAADTARAADSYARGGSGSEINTSASDWPAPPVWPTGPGIGTPYLATGANAYSPEGGADPKHPHLFHLATTQASVWEGGSIQ